MEEKLYNEIKLVVNAIDAMIEHLAVVINELPDIILLINDLINLRTKLTINHQAWTRLWPSYVQASANVGSKLGSRLGLQAWPKCYNPCSYQHRSKLGFQYCTKRGKSWPKLRPSLVQWSIPTWVCSECVQDAA